MNSQTNVIEETNIGAVVGDAPESRSQPVYLDCNATTPIDPRVREAVLHFLSVDFGNAGSRTHDFGNRAKKAVQSAREQVAAVVDCKSDEVVFTSGATESNNLAILGLSDHGEKVHKPHIVSSQIEHKSVLEPLGALQTRGFEVTLVPPTQDGLVEPERIREALRPDTLLVSLMHVNNETGVKQPIAKVADVLRAHDAFFHVDAAQGFGKDIETPRNPRIDLISISGHKIYGPKGVGALVARRRGYQRVPLTPLFYGGGQERGLRPGTLAVPLIVGLGLAADLALREYASRADACLSFREQLLKALEPLEPTFNGSLSNSLPHVVNVTFPGVDAEAVILALKDHVALSNGSACTSQNYTPSHVLRAMSLPDEAVRGGVRISWCHMTEDPEWSALVTVLRSLR